MTLSDIILVAVPETLISILFGLKIAGQLRDYWNKRIKFLTNVILSLILIIAYEYYIRSSIPNIMITAYLTLFVYISTFKLVWKLNYRQSFLIGSCSVFIFIASDVVTIPIVNAFVVNNEIIKIFHFRFLLSLPSRLLQLLILVIAFRFNIVIISKYLIDKWDKTNKKNIFIVHSLIISILLCIFLITNNSDLYVKLLQSGINTEFLTTNIQLNFFCTVFFMLICIMVFIVASKYIEYKEIVLKTPEQICNDIAQHSTFEQLNTYRSIFDKYISKKEVNV